MGRKERKSMSIVQAVCELPNNYKPAGATAPEMHELVKQMIANQSDRFLYSHGSIYSFIYSEIS